MSNQNIVGKINNFYQDILNQIYTSTSRTPFTVYSAHLCATSMLPILLILQITDGNRHLRSSVMSNSYIIVTTNFLLKYLGDEGIVNHLTNNLFNLTFMFDNPMLLNHKHISEVFNHMVINKNFSYFESIHMVKHILFSLTMTYLILGKIIPGFISPDDYLEINYILPVLRLYRNDSRYAIEDFEKVMRILYVIPKKDLCVLHKSFVYLSNKIGIAYKKGFVTLQDFILCIHAFLEEYSGIKIYSLNEIMSMTSHNPYRLESFVFNFLSNKKKTYPLNLNKLTKIGKTNLSQISKLIKNKTHVLENINHNDIHILTNNIINLASSAIPSYVKYQNMYFNQYSRFAMRNIVLDSFRELSYDILGSLITLVFNDDRNLDQIANYTVPVEDLHNGRFISQTLSNLVYQKYVPFFLYKIWKFDLEVEINNDNRFGSSGFAYHIPYEILQGLSYLIESISILYNFGYTYAEINNFKLNNIFGLQNYPEHLAGGILTNIICRHSTLPNRIKEYVFSSNSKIITYLMYQLSHNMSEFNINYIDLLSGNDINFNIFNTFLMTKINTGLISASSSELVSEINSTLYERLCLNNYLDMLNSQKDIVVVMGYISYLLRLLPNINLRFSITNSKYLTLGINKLFTSDMDNFAQYYKLLKRIIPGSYSLEQAIMLREFVSSDGCFRYNWLEQIVNTLFVLSYHVADSEFLVQTISGLKIQKNSGIFNNLFRFAACHYVPKSEYSSYNAAHIIQALALNEDVEYRSNSANYYQYFVPSDYLSDEINIANGSSYLIGSLDDKFKFIQDSDIRKPVKITLGNNSIYNKFIDGDKYYNKACEVINLYEKRKFMLHIMCRYKQLMNLFNNIDYVDMNDKRIGIIRIVNLGEVVKFIMYEILCTPFQTSFIQIYNNNNEYTLESNKSKTEFVRPLVGYLRSSILFCHHAQIARFHDECGVYNPNSLERALYIFNSILSVYHNSTMYNFKMLNKHAYNPRWFRSINVFNNKSRCAIIIKANKIQTINSSLYIGRFTYEFAFRFKSNLYSISFAPILILMKNLFNRVTNIGILSIKNINKQEIQYYGSHRASIGSVLLLLDLLGNQVISRLLAPSKYNLVSEPIFRRYKIRNELITEYSASNIIYLPLLALQSCNQYVKTDDSNISIVGNPNSIIGIMPVSEFSTQITFDIIGTVLVAFMKLIYVFLSILTLFIKSINKLISKKYPKSKINRIEKKLLKEKEELKSYEKQSM